MKIYDITLPISEDMVTWPGDPTVTLEQVKSISNADKCNITRMQMGIHTGTHVDAPFHFINDGAKLGSVPMDNFIGRCIVIELDSSSIVTKQDLEKHNIYSHSRVLLKTTNSELWKNEVKTFNPAFIGLGIQAAEYLVFCGVKLIGIDYLSIESNLSSNNEVHKLLLKNNISILEGLNLSEVKAGVYELICLPMKLQICEGAPARVILRETL